MRFLLPSLILMLFISLTTIYRFQSTALTPSNTALLADQSGEMFVAYVGAVAAFMRNNPTFNGTISGAQLASQGRPFSTPFLQMASNAVTTFGTNGRTITTYATLPVGALNSVISVTERDASYGLASGMTWTSITPGSTAQPLATSVPHGSIVSVIQLSQ